MDKKWNETKNKKLINASLRKLQAIAKQRGLKEYKKLDKIELLQLLDGSLGKYRAIAEQHGLRDYSKLNKKDLQQLVMGYESLLDMFPKGIARPTLKNKFIEWVNWLMKYVPRFHEVLNKLKKYYKKADVFELEESKSALKKFTTQYTVPGKDGYDPQTFLKIVEPEVTKLLTDNRSIKVKLILKCSMVKTDLQNGEEIRKDAAFHSDVNVILEATDLNEVYDTMSGTILERLATFQQHGSNWRFKSVINLEVHTVKYKPLEGSSYIELPNELLKKKAIVNPENKDNECFKWVVARAMNPVEKNPQRITKDLIKQANEFVWKDIEFPTTLKDIDKFEKHNPTMAINVFGYEKEIHPLRISELEREKTINMLLISDGSKNHYCWIKSMSRLLSSQTTKKHQKRLYCLRCLNGFPSEKSLNEHKESCSSREAVKVKLPNAGTFLGFKNYNRSMRVPFIVYADFESFTAQLDTCQPNPANSYTNQYQKHTPSGFCYYIKCYDDEVYSREPVVYVKQSEHDDVAQTFVERIEKDIKEIHEQFKIPKKMIFNAVDKKAFSESTKCHICDEDLGVDRVRDHCHLSGKYRGAAHDKCNIDYKIPKFIPVVFHNLSGYDSHLFIKKLGGKINCIPTNEEKYISFSKEVIVDQFINEDGKKKDVKRELRFIDSFRFMASSLDSLVSNLNEEQCVNLKKYYSGKQFDLLRRKGVYPYDYIGSVEKLSETALPQKEKFYSRLNDEDISDEDYHHAQTVWKAFGCKTFRDYHMLYNKSDVLQLADVFENFRDVCVQYYKLDPAWYYTSPGLAWDAALKMTKVKLELLSDPDMLLMIENGIRGGISTISHRYSKANNKYMGDKYDPNQPPKFIMYLDVNNLYAFAMSEPLPTHGFKWMNEPELTNWKSVPCILEVDLEYPTELHDLHNLYPLVPEIIKIGNVKKLTPNLNNKTKYVVHYENLKLYESLGLKITKIHRGITFEKSPWLKKYIDFNTKLRTEAKNNFEKDFFKLMNNSVFGKTMENIRRRVDVKLVTSEKEAKKLAAKPNYDHCTIFDENLVAIHMKQTKLTFDKPVYLGMCILDLSKTLMYDFHYNYIQKKYGDKAKLLFTDTDSLAYEIQTDDFYEDIRPDLKLKFDTSDYPDDHILEKVNKKVVGMFKDEACGKQIVEFVGLRSKLYSYKMLEGDEHKKCKGVKKKTVEKTITIDDYKQVLLSKVAQPRKMNVIRSHLHDVYTEELNKVALSADDDKRIIMADCIHTLAHGHYRLMQQHAS
jgi:hypothetical protein